MKDPNVSDYRPQSEDNIALVNEAEALEERVLRFLDRLAATGKADGRWFSIGRTDIEKGFMAVNRSVFQPGRVSLPDEAKSNVSWLIEHGDSLPDNPVYFTVGDSGWEWDADHMRAFVFSSRDDAQAILRILPKPERLVHRICEHAWS